MSNIQIAILEYKFTTKNKVSDEADYEGKQWLKYCTLALDFHQSVQQRQPQYIWAENKQENNTAKMY